MLAETGEENKFPSDMCQDVLCLIAKQIEQEQLRVQFEDLETS